MRLIEKRIAALEAVRGAGLEALTDEELDARIAAFEERMGEAYKALTFEQKIALLKLEINTMDEVAPCQPLNAGFLRWKPERAPPMIH